MGICGSAGLNYYECEVGNESAIRTFEREHFGLNVTGFSDVYNNLASMSLSTGGNLDKDSYEKFLRLPETRNARNLAHHPYFFDGEDVRQVRVACLFFLLTGPKRVTVLAEGNEYTYYDKARFVYNTIKGDIEPEKQLTAENPKLAEFIKILLEISLQILVEYHQKTAEAEETEIYSEALKKKDEIVNKIVEILASQERGQRTVLEHIDYFFFDDFHFLGSGYLRELALYNPSSKAAEKPEEEKKEEKKEKKEDKEEKSEKKEEGEKKEKKKEDDAKSKSSSSSSDKDEVQQLDLDNEQMF